MVLSDHFPFMKKFKEKFVFFGPGFLLAIAAAGEAGIADALEIGAEFGVSLTWIVVLTLLFKYAFTTGIARYTLSTGNTIYQGIVSLPGPKHWGAYFTIFAYLLESIGIGSMLYFTSVFFDYLIPGTFLLLLLGSILLVLALIILRTHLYHHFEPIMAGIVLLIGLFMVFFMIDNPMLQTVIFPEIANGLIPSIPEHSEKSILAILGVVGSGLTLMLYSVWLEKKIRNIAPKTEVIGEERKTIYTTYLKSVRLDILFGFILVFLLTIGFLAVGYFGMQASLIPHGVELTFDMLMTAAMNFFRVFPFGKQIMLLLFALLFFGALVVSLDARASALTKVIKQLRIESGKPVKNSSIVYNICLLLISTIGLLAMIFGNPLEIQLFVAMSCAILFGLYGFILIYLNSKLPEYAKGNRLWVLFISIGSALSIYFAFVLEGNILSTGVPLLKNLALVLIILFLICRSKMFKRIVSGNGALTDKVWLILILGTVSILGTLWGINAGDYIINFRDVGAIVGGIIGGPIVGGIIGFIGGIYRLTLGGATAVPCFIATVVAGVVSGFAIRIWKGKRSILKLIILAIVAECLHLLVIFPTYEILFGTMGALEVWDVIRSTIAPMVGVTAFGLLGFFIFTRKISQFTGPLERFSLTRLKEDIRKLTSRDTDDGDDTK